MKDSARLFDPCRRWELWAEAPFRPGRSCVNCARQYRERVCRIYRRRFLRLTRRERIPNPRK